MNEWMNESLATGHDRKLYDDKSDNFPSISGYSKSLNFSNILIGTASDPPPSGKQTTFTEQDQESQNSQSAHSLGSLTPCRLKYVV